MKRSGSRNANSWLTTGRRIERSALQELHDTIAWLRNGPPECRRTAAILEGLANQAASGERVDFSRAFQLRTPEAQRREARNRVIYAVDTTLSGGRWERSVALARLVLGTGTVSPDLADEFEQHRPTMPTTPEGIRKILTQREQNDLLGGDSIPETQRTKGHQR